jgi:hypothetical protein
VQEKGENRYKKVDQIEEILCKNFVLNNMNNFESIFKFENRSDMMKVWSFGDSMRSRI